MEAKLRVVFLMPNGDHTTKTFTEQPLGLQFRSHLPIVIKRLRDGSQAAQLGVRAGWQVQSINGKPLAGMTLYQAYTTFVHSSAPLRQCMLVRTTPLDAMPVPRLSAKLKSLEDIEVVPFLMQHGFQAQSSSFWGKNVKRPELHFEIHGHREMGRPRRHTWYTIVGTIHTGEASSTRRWAVERRLAHIRTLLHDPIKRELGNKYNHYFHHAHFAHHGGLPGSTARMLLWLAVLSKAIIAGAVSPGIVASMFNFLEAPSLSEHIRQKTPTTEPVRTAACNPNVQTTITENNTVKSVESGAGACTRQAPGDENGRSLQDDVQQDNPKIENDLCQESDLLETGVDDAVDIESDEEAPCEVVTENGVEDAFEFETDEEEPCEPLTMSGVEDAHDSESDEKLVDR